ncbi:hypothetical protein GCK72_022473 [Caenorhabditis remanei]|uniref:Uncharacterized protein n=1 Tax=Caenorhabditis remanei TaxID=31234 RepID=A0A6A5FTY0_CAERE|nr:hypothetical protein GCK72_022473 [Caenorhabditis remanei]KAF1746022.1 hypothetical protein GCK72_022473 [Caenorhabditis remanei]
MSATPVKDRLKAKAEKKREDQAHHLRCCMGNERFRHNPFWHADCCPLNVGSKNGEVQCTPIPSPRTLQSGPMPPSKPIATSAPTPVPKPLPTPTPLQKHKSIQTNAPHGKKMEEKVEKMRGVVEKMNKEFEKMERKMKEQKKAYEATNKQIKDNYEGFISRDADRRQILEDRIIELAERCVKMEEKVTNEKTALIKMEEANAKEQEALKNELLASNQAVNAGKLQIQQQKEEIAHLQQQLDAAKLKELELAKTNANQSDEILQLKNALAASTIKEKGAKELLSDANALIQIKMDEVETLKKELRLKTLWEQAKESERSSVEMLQKKVDMLQLDNQRLRSQPDPQSGASVLSITTTNTRIPVQAPIRWAQSSLADSPRSRPTSGGVAITDSAEPWNQPPPSILALTGGGSESSGSAPLDLHQLSTSTTDSTWIQDPLAMFSSLMNRSEATPQFPASTVHSSSFSNVTQHNLQK